MSLRQSRVIDCESSEKKFHSVFNFNSLLQKIVLTVSREKNRPVQRKALVLSDGCIVLYTFDKFSM